VIVVVWVFEGGITSVEHGRSLVFDCFVFWFLGFGDPRLGDRRGRLHVYIVCRKILHRYIHGCKKIVGILLLYTSTYGITRFNTQKATTPLPVLACRR
jgi:hypothetical protein